VFQSVYLLSKPVQLLMVVNQFGAKPEILKPVQLAHPHHVSVLQFDPLDLLLGGEVVTSHRLAPEFGHSTVEGVHPSPLPSLPIAVNSAKLIGK
jgi:hypothetical protein